MQEKRIMTIGQMVASTFKKACNYIGLEEIAEPVSEKVGNVVNLDEHRYPSFSELFPYQYFDKESKIFFNKNQNKGVMLSRVNYFCRLTTITTAGHL